MAASVAYFRSLPLGYRPLVLDQLRSMGGTRFFVSLNDKPLNMQVLPATPRKEAVLEVVDDVLRERLGRQVDLSVQFVSPDDLRIFNGELKLDELPRSWAHYALSLEPLNPPVLVTQIQIAPNEWLYLASLMPEPYVGLEDQACRRSSCGSSSSPAPSCCCSSACWCIGRAGRSSAWPPPHGTCPWVPTWSRSPRRGSEVVEVSRAFNSMRERISRYLNERSQLFSAISHDLRTPSPACACASSCWRTKPCKPSSAATSTTWSCWSRARCNA